MGLFSNIKYGIGLAGWRPGEGKLESGHLSNFGKPMVRSVYDTSFGTPVTFEALPLTEEDQEIARERARAIRAGVVDVGDFPSDLPLPLSDEDQEILGTLSKDDQEIFIEFAKMASSIPTVELVTELVHYRDEREKQGDPIELKENLDPVHERDAILFGIHFMKMKKGEKIIAAAAVKEEEPPVQKEIPIPDPESETQSQDKETITLAQALDNAEKKRKSKSRKGAATSTKEVDPAEAESPQE